MRSFGIPYRLPSQPISSGRLLQLRRRTAAAPAPPSARIRLPSVSAGSQVARAVDDDVAIVRLEEVHQGREPLRIERVQRMRPWPVAPDHVQAAVAREVARQRMLVEILDLRQRRRQATLRRQVEQSRERRGVDVEVQQQVGVRASVARATARLQATSEVPTPPAAPSTTVTRALRDAGDPAHAVVVHGRARRSVRRRSPARAGSRARRCGRRAARPRLCPQDPRRSAAAGRPDSSSPAPPARRGCRCRSAAPARREVARDRTAGPLGRPRSGEWSRQCRGARASTSARGLERLLRATDERDFQFPCLLGQHGIVALGLNRPAALPCLGMPRLSRGSVAELGALNVGLMNGIRSEWRRPRSARARNGWRRSPGRVLRAPRRWPRGIPRGREPRPAARRSMNVAASVTPASPTRHTAATRAPRRAASCSTFMVKMMRPNSIAANRMVTSTAPTIANSTVVRPRCRALVAWHPQEIARMVTEIRIVGASGIASPKPKSAADRRRSAGTDTRHGPRRRTGRPATTSTSGVRSPAGRPVREPAALPYTASRCACWRTGSRDLDDPARPGDGVLAHEAGTAAYRVRQRVVLHQCPSDLDHGEHDEQQQRHGKDELDCGEAPRSRRTAQFRSTRPGLGVS